jgi:hypothetical protein
VLASSSFLDILVSPVVGLVIGAEQPDQFEYFLLGHYIPQCGDNRTLSCNAGMAAGVAS